MAVKSKKEKVNEARKNAEALKAQKKSQRDAKAKQVLGNVAGGTKQGGQKKGPSLIKQASKKKK